MCEINLQPVIQAEALARGAALPLCLRIAFSTLSTSEQSSILKQTENHVWWLQHRQKIDLFGFAESNLSHRKFLRKKNPIPCGFEFLIKLFTSSASLSEDDGFSMSSAPHLAHSNIVY